MITLKPRTPPKIVNPAAIEKPRIREIFGSIFPTRVKTVSVASVASETRTVSQPTKIKYESKPGTTFPLTPKAARESVIVGAFARLPARELIPTKKKDATVPIIAAKVACQNDIPNPRKKEPYESARSETFAAAHGQNSERADPLLSFCAMKLVPFISNMRLRVEVIDKIGRCLRMMSF